MANARNAIIQLKIDRLKGKVNEFFADKESLKKELQRQAQKKISYKNFSVLCFLCFLNLAELESFLWKVRNLFRTFLKELITQAFNLNY